MKVSFITNGGSNMGMGHVYRTLLIANEIKDRSETFFITSSDASVVNKINEDGFRIIKTINNSEVAKRLSEIKPDVIVVDMLNVEESFARDLKNISNNRLVLFENLIPESNRYADIVINAVMGANFKNNRFLDKGSNTLYLYGPKYFAFKEDVYKYKKLRKEIRAKANRVLLIFGGSDPSSLTAPALDELLKSDDDFMIDVIVGAHFGHDDELNSVLAKHNGKIKNVSIYRDINTVAEVMFNSDVVVCSPGLSAYEALCLGTPIIVFHHNEWQRKGFEGFIDTLGKEKMHKLASLIVNQEFTDPRKDNICEMLIGEGKNEIIEAILEGR